MAIPYWLLRDEAYTPRPDRDAFIHRTTRSLLRALGALRRRTGGGSARGGPDARIGLASTFLVVLLVSLSRSTLFLATAGTLFLVILCFQRAETIRDVLSASLPAGLFVLAVALPSAFWGNTAGVVRLVLKVLICVGRVRFFSAVTEWRQITRSLAVCRVPDLFILVLDTTLRSIALLGEVSLALLDALRLRSVGSNREKTAALSGIAGTVFLKARELTEDMQAAMECRGFTGSYRMAREPRPRVRDCLPLLVVALLAGVFVVTGG